MFGSLTVKTKCFMKKILFYLLSIILIASCNTINDNKGKADETLVIPRPTGPRKERKKIKKAFFENMHRAEEGFDWKEHNKKMRWKKYEEKKNSKTTNPVNGEWLERGSANQSGRIHTAELDTVNNILYCASSGGNIWKGSPEGENWQSTNDELKFYDIKMLKMIQNDSLNRLVVSSGASEFYYTDNEGDTWNQSTGLESIIDWGHIKKSVVANDSLHSIYVLASEWDDNSWSAVSKVYKSTNQGESFEFVKKYSSNIDKVDIWAPYHNSDTLFILANKSIYTLAPNQEAPILRTTIQSSTNGYSLLTGCATEESTTLYAYINHELHKSDTNGLSWYFVNELEDSPFFSMSFNASITNPDLVYFGEVECHVSYDGGQNWVPVNYWTDYYIMPETQLHADIPNIKSQLTAQGNEITYVSTDGGLYISDDDLHTVQNISLNGLNVGQYYSIYTNRNNTNYIYAGSQDQGFQRTDNGNADTPIDFEQVISGDYGHIVSTDGGNSLWTVYPGFAQFYPDAQLGDGSSAWHFPDNATELWLPPLVADPIFENTVYLAGGYLQDGGSHIIMLDYNGSMSSQQLSFDFKAASGGGYITAMEISPLNENYWYVLTNNGKFFASTDYGTTWEMTESFTGPSNHYFYGASIQASHMSLGKVYIAGSGYSNPGVYMTDNNGDSFTALNEGLPSTMIYDVAATYGDEYIFAATELGPYIYISEEDKWEDLSMGIAPDQTYWSVEFVDEIKTARFGTYGRGIWDFKLNEETSSIGLNENLTTPVHVKVYPNPATDYIEINAEAEISSWKLIDALGKEVASSKYLVSNKNLTLDVSPFQAGIYFLELDINGQRITKQLIKD